MGYTPVFDSVYRGTLCGQWPTLPVWLTILPLADANGEIDYTTQAISSMTGWPMELLLTALEKLTSPDPDSRSTDSDGRRLELVDPANRKWGWRVVNHSKYREKARLTSKAARESASGVNADRMQQRRKPEPIAEPETREIKPVDLAVVDLAASEAEIHAQFERIKAAYPKITGRANWLHTEHLFRNLLDAGHTTDEILAGTRRYAIFCDKTGKAGTQFVLAPTTFFNTADKPFLSEWTVSEPKEKQPELRTSAARPFPRKVQA